jgi:hypothetical protein
MAGGAPDAPWEIRDEAGNLLITILPPNTPGGMIVMTEIGHDVEMGAAMSGDPLTEGLKSYAQLVREGRAPARRGNAERLEIDPHHRDYIYFRVPPYPAEKEFAAQWGHTPRPYRETATNVSYSHTKLINAGNSGRSRLLFIKIDPARSRWIYSGWRTDLAYKDTLRRHLAAPIEEASISHANGVYPDGVIGHEIEVVALTPVIGPEWFVYPNYKTTKTEYFRLAKSAKGGRRRRTSLRKKHSVRRYSQRRR